MILNPTYYARHRMSEFQRNYMYFLGFGFIVTFILGYFDFLTALGIYGIISPLLLLISLKAEPQGSERYFPRTFEVFYEADKILYFLNHFRLLEKLITFVEYVIRVITRKRNQVVKNN